MSRKVVWFSIVKQGRGALLAMLLVINSVFGPPCVSLGQNLTLGVLPRFSSEFTYKQASQLASYLSGQLGQPVTPVATSNFAEYSNRILHGAIIIGYENPVVFVAVSGKHEALVTAVKDGVPRLRGVVIVRQDSPIVSLEGLRDKTIAAVGEDSAGGYLSQKVSLREAGMELGRDCRVVIGADNKQENVILSVYTGDVDAGFIRRDALERVANYIPVDQIRILQETAWLPNWVVSVNTALDPHIKTSLAKALLQLTPQDPVTRSFDIEGFQAVDVNDLETVRRGM